MAFPYFTPVVKDVPPYEESYREYKREIEQAEAEHKAAVAGAMAAYEAADKAAWAVFCEFDRPFMDASVKAGEAAWERHQQRLKALYPEGYPEEKDRGTK